MTNRVKGKILKGVALSIDVVAPLMATLSQFPIWVEKSSGATMSGLFILFAIISSIPAIRFFKNNHKTPSSAIIWSVLFFLLFALEKIIEQMLAVCFVGMLANLVGAALYKGGAILENHPDPPPAEDEEEFEE